jgi:DNA-binding NtrC family response regulator
MNELSDLLVVDDDDDFRETLVQRLRRRGYRVRDVSDGLAALAELGRRQFALVVTDLMMPNMSGLELLEKLKGTDSECEVILLTGEATIETAVKAMKLGAYDYLTKPCSLTEFDTLVDKAIERRRLAQENVHLKQVIERSQPQTEMIGNSPALKEVWRLIERAGPTDKAILIQGESGTGKELVARALHRRSLRAAQPLVAINCAALPETLLESELFGHEKGAFTGAVAAKPGFFEMADGGTLFIDEIGEMPGSLQAKLLRVLEDGSMRRIGSVKERRVDVRLLAATNRNMAEEVKAGRFREDLFYRINVMSLQLPPLRDRADDIPLLVRHFLGPDWKIEPEALEAMQRYRWPGNVRQLINALERAKILADDYLILVDELPHEVTAGGDMTGHATANGVAVEAPISDELAALQKAHVLEVLKRERGNKARAARALGVNRRSLYRMLEKYGIHTGEHGG